MWCWATGEVASCGCDMVEDEGVKWFQGNGVLFSSRIKERLGGLDHGSKPDKEAINADCIGEIGNERLGRYCVRRQNEWKNARSQLLIEIRSKGGCCGVGVPVCPLTTLTVELELELEARKGCDSEALTEFAKNKSGRPCSRSSGEAGWLPLRWRLMNQPGGPWDMDSVIRCPVVELPRRPALPAKGDQQSLRMELF